jgi:transmembrane sensor
MIDQAEQIRALCARQAGDWFVAHRDGPLGAEDVRMFQQWLLASPHNVEEYLGVAAVAQLLPRAARHEDWSVDAMVALAATADARQLRHLPSAHDQPGPAVRPARSANTVRRIFATAAVLIIWVAASLWWGREHAAALRYETGHGGQQTVRLPDASVLQLNTDTSLTVHMGRAERLVVIEHGQAFFTVAHEPSRPFRVLAGHTDVIAVGTRFDVHRELDATLVTVSEGRVSVGVPGSRPRRVMVAADQQLRIEAEVLPPSPAPVNATHHAAWLRRQVVFNQQSLPQVAAEFNRYSATPIRVEPRGLDALRVSGVFSVDDVDSFVAFLKNLRGVAVESTPAQIRVRAAPAAASSPLPVR